MRKSTIITVIIIVASVLALGAYVVYSMGNFLLAYDGVLHEEMTDEEKAKFSSLALLPELKDNCVRYNVRYKSTPRDGKYEYVIVECSDISCLPEEYRDAFSKALASDDDEDHYSGEDLGDNAVDIYRVKEGLPFAEKDELPEEYRELANGVMERYYLILDYGNGVKKFQFCIAYQ